LEADCLEIFETGQILLATLGYPIFSAVGRPTVVPTQFDEPGHAIPDIAPTPQPSTSNTDELFFCKADGVDGRGLYTQEGFVVLEGSIGRRENMNGLVGHAYEHLRLKLQESGVVREHGGSIIFAKDHLFRKPTPAAVALMGRTANGWVEWKNQEGKTLNEMKRQATMD
jgi:hypothetical protein